MPKRLISANPQDILQFTPSDLFQSIKASEGRVVMAECIVSSTPYVEDLTNAEIARAFGADLILLNLLDVQKPQIAGLWGQKGSRYASVPEGSQQTRAQTADRAAALSNCVKRLQKLVACPLGVNLEPVDEQAHLLEAANYLAAGRLATLPNFQLCAAAHFDFICLTGNPASAVTNDAIVKAIKAAKSVFPGLIIAGKMHSSGVDEAVVDAETVEAFIDAGADIILLPAPCTVPSFGQAEFSALAKLIHKSGKLLLSVVGTSQESADPAVIRDLALMCKSAGADIQHLGDGGYGGLAPTENIFTLSKTVRGLKHTISRVARSIARSDADSE